MNRLSPRSGFHRIDAVVLTAVVLLLIAVALPAIESARETANRATCSNHLKQLAIAAHGYHDTHKTLPPGWMGPDTPPGGLAAAFADGQSNGPFPHLLPYLGCEKLFDKLRGKLIWDPKRPAGDLWFSLGLQAIYNDAALEAAATPLPFLQCPSDFDTAVLPSGDQSDKRRHGKLMFAIGSKTTTKDKGGKPGNPKTADASDPLAVDWGRSAPGEWSGKVLMNSYDSITRKYNPFGRVNYVPVAGLGGGESPFYQQFEGVFTGRSDITLAAISAADGTSTTLMFGETTGQFLPTDGDNVLQMNLFAACGEATARGLQQRCAPGVLEGRKPSASTCDDKTFTIGLGQKARYGVFSSAHPAGVQFVFCDGSVRLIRRGRTCDLGSPDWYLLQQMAGFHDGFHRDVSGLLP